MTARAVIHSKARDGTNEAKLAKTIATSLVPDLQVETCCLTPKTLAGIWRSDLLIVHSPLIFSFGAILVAKILCRPIVAFVWDLYPVMIYGRRYDKRIRRRIADAIERFAIWASDHLIVQSEDFTSSPSLARAKVIPFWYVPQKQQLMIPVAMDQRSRLQFAFAGQINETRGLSETITSLDNSLTRRAILNIYSSSRFNPPENLKHLEVRHCGYLPKKRLAAALCQNDIGLVSLHPGFDGPAFPSKSIDYLAAGLPIAYFGPPLPCFSALLEASHCGTTVNPGTRMDFDLVLNIHSRYASAAKMFFDRVRADPVQLKSHIALILGCRTDTLSTKEK